MRTSVTVAAATAGLVTAGMLSWTGTATAGRSAQTLHLTTTTEQFAFVDQGGPGPGVGDQLIFSDRVHRAGEPAGTSGSTCTVVRLAAPTMTCQTIVTFALPDGQLTLQGLTDGPDHPPASGESFPSPSPSPAAPARTAPPVATPWDGTTAAAPRSTPSV